MRRKYTAEQDEAEVDMTPMLDIVFIMLIFFIVTTSFMRASGIEINRPSPNPNTQEQKETQNVLLTIDAADNITLGSGYEARKIDARSIGANIEKMKASNPETTVIVKAHDISSVDVLMRVLDAAKSAGVSQGKISVSNYNK